MIRRAVTLCLSLLAFNSLMALPVITQASPYPERPVRVLAGVAPGGATDVLARLFSQHVGQALNGTFVVENRAGAGGIIAADTVAKAPPDGYTLLVSTPTVMVVAPYIYPQLRFSPATDFDPVAVIGGGPLILVAHASVPASNLDELREHIAKHPQRVSFGSGGKGSASHLTAELFANRAGLNMVHVPYKGDGQAVTDLLGGHVDMMFTAYSLVEPYVRSGQLKAYAVTSLERFPAVPEIPTLHELGLTGFNAMGWIGVFAPKGTPAAIRQQLSGTWNQQRRTPEVARQLANFGSDLLAFDSPAAFAAFIRQDDERWANIIRDAGVTPE